MTDFAHFGLILRRTMSSIDKQGPDDQVLSRYLLGSLPAEEAERLDELSIADDEFSLRLDAVENDLLDSYVRNELSGETLARFESVYLFSPRKLEKVEFARTLLRWDKKTAGAKESSAATRSSERWFGVLRLSLQWGFAAATLVMSIGIGYLLVENGRLRNLRVESREQQAILEQRTQEMEKQLSDLRSANLEMQKELAQARDSQAGFSPLTALTVLLLPQTRGVGPIRTIFAPSTGQIRLRLQLELDDFPQYRIAIKDSASNSVVWRSETLKSTAAGRNKEVSVSLSVTLLEGKNYVLELSGVSPNGASEFVSSYVFRLIKR
jgi:hypothetical protein